MTKFKTFYIDAASEKNPTSEKDAAIAFHKMDYFTVEVNALTQEEAINKFLQHFPNATVLTCKLKK